jgi:hypothetical protein
MCSWKAWNAVVVNEEKGLWNQVWGNAGIDLPGTPKVGKWYRLKIVSTGNIISFYVDGELLFERKDDLHPSGGVSLWAYNAIVEFDNVVITGDEIPDMGPSGYVVQPQGGLTASWGVIKK